MRALLRALMNALGITTIYEATNGDDAFDILRNLKPDLILTDLSMKPINGIEFTLQVRNAASSPNPYIPIIMITGHTERHRVEAARDAGVTEFLAKPITAQSLFSRVGEIVDHPRAFREMRRLFRPGPQASPQRRLLRPVPPPRRFPGRRSHRLTLARGKQDAPAQDASPQNRPSDGLSAAAAGGAPRPGDANAAQRRDAGESQSRDLSQEDRIARRGARTCRSESTRRRAHGLEPCLRLGARNTRHGGDGWTFGDGADRQRAVPLSRCSGDCSAPNRTVRWRLCISTPSFARRAPKTKRCVTVTMVAEQLSVAGRPQARRI